MGFDPFADGHAKLVGGLADIAAQCLPFAAGDLFLRGFGFAVLGEESLPANDGVVDLAAGFLDQFVDRIRGRAGLELSLKKAFLFGDLSLEDFLLGHGAQALDESDSREHPDRPLGGVPLPWLHAIAVVVLELVVEIMVALTKREQCHEHAVPRRAVCGIRTVSDPVAQRVNTKRHVVNKNDTRCSRDEESAKRGHRAAVDPPDQGRQEKADDDRDRDIVFVLPPCQAILLEVAHPSERGLGAGAEKQPADVGVEEPLGNIVGVLVVINKLVMSPMISAPAEGRTLKGRRPEEQGIELDWPSGIKREVREQTVVAQRDAHCGRDREEEEQANLEGINTEVPDVSRNGDDRRQECSDEERAVDPMDFVAE